MFPARLAPPMARRVLSLRTAPSSSRHGATRHLPPVAPPLRLALSSRSLSTLPPPPIPTADAPAAPTPKPPSSLTSEMATGIQDSTRLLLKHGLGAQRLRELSESGSKGDPTTLVSRWQRMMEAFLGTQVHVLAGMGYEPTERGLAFYNQQLAMLMMGMAPDEQEKLRLASRDTWREVLATAFDVPLEEVEGKELSIVDARNVMHKVSLRMQDQAVLDKISERCRSVEGDKAKNDVAEIQVKHTIVQDVLVNDVYLGGGPPTLVEECGFGSGERGYVLMQCVMAEHQSDPLVSQYVGSGMMKVLQAAGLDPATLQQAAARAREEASDR